MSNPTKPELEFHRQVAAIGCIACLLDGHYNPLVSIHHVDGRTKPGCQRKVLPLCAGHHQNGTGNDKTMIAVHPFKSRFQERYGHQDRLLVLVYTMVVQSSFNHAHLLDAYREDR
jgi:Recombination enhancement, RecA-dependent nuclease